MKDMKAKIERSLLAKMLVGGLGTVLILGLAWYVIGGSLRSEENSRVALNETALATEIAMLQVRRSEKDALIRDVVSAEFFQTGKGKYMGKHAKALKTLYTRIDQLRGWRELMGEENIKALEKQTNTYAQGFVRLMEAHHTLGYASFGLIGRLRADQSRLVESVAEAGSPNLVEPVRKLERLETEYVLFEQDAVGRELAAQTEAVLSMTRADTELREHEAIVSALETHRDNVNAILDLQQTIGVREDDGLRGQMRTAIHALAPLMEETRALAKRLEEEAHASQDLAAIVLLVAGLLGAGIVFVLYARSITRPVALLRDAAHRLGRGEFDAKVEVASNDEIGELAEAFTRMACNLKEAEYERGQVFTAITETTSRLAAASSEILASTTQQSAGSEEQAAAVSQTVATIDEVLHAAEEGAARATEVSEASRESMDNSRAGTQSVETTIERMRKLRERSEELSASILELDGRAESIGVIIATVNDIAEQTNLLALNAAIEASRAGEHGKGFAVVAAEVRALADECKKATSQVRDLLGEVQRATRLAVSRTRESADGANEAMSSAEQTGETIQSLEQALSGQSQVAAQINASARQQAIGIKQINEAMRSIDQVTRQNVDSNRQTQRAMEDLSALGDRLREIVGGHAQESRAA